MSRIYDRSVSSLTGMPLYRALHWARQQLEQRLQPAFMESELRSFAEQRGIVPEQLKWRLNYSHGDGVAFYGQLNMPCLLAYFKRADKSAAEEARWIDYLGFVASCKVQGEDSLYHHAHSQVAQVTVTAKTKLRKRKITGLNAAFFSCEGGLTEAGASKLELKRQELEGSIKEHLRLTSRATTEHGYKLLHMYYTESHVLAWIHATKVRFTQQGYPVLPEDFINAQLVRSEDKVFDDERDNPCRCENRTGVYYTGLRGVTAWILNGVLQWDDDPEKPPLHLCESCERFKTPQEALAALVQAGIKVPQSIHEFYHPAKETKDDQAGAAAQTKADSATAKSRGKRRKRRKAQAHAKAAAAR